MFITFSKVGIILCLSILALTQLTKYVLSKFKVPEIWVTYLPVIILVISYISYSIILKNFGIDSIMSAISLTAFSCYTYDVVKALIKLFKTVIGR